MQAILIAFVESMMTLQHQVMTAWEAFLPEAQAVQLE